MSLRFAESVNAAEISEEMGNSLETLLSTNTHVIADLRGIGVVSAEDLILEARGGSGGADKAMSETPVLTG